MGAQADSQDACQEQVERRHLVQLTPVVIQGLFLTVDVCGQRIIIVTTSSIRINEVGEVAVLVSEYMCHKK